MKSNLLLPYSMPVIHQNIFGTFRFYCQKCIDKIMIIYYIISNLCYTFSSPQSWNCPATFHTPLTVPDVSAVPTPTRRNRILPRSLPYRTAKKEGEIAENSLVISPSLDYQPLLHQASSQILPTFHQVCIHSQTHCTDDSGVLAQCRSHHIL